MHSKEEVINLINNHLKKQIQIFEEKTNVLINSKIKLIENTFSDKINKEIKKFKKDELNRELDEIKNEFKEELNSTYENTVKNLKTNIGEIKKETENYINENKDQVESKTSISLFQINGVENQAIEQIRKLLEFSIDSINSAEKTSLNNLNKYKLSLEEEFEVIKASYKKSIDENKESTMNEIDEKKNQIMQSLNNTYISSVQSLSETKDELIKKFNNVIDETKNSLNLYKEQLESDLESKKNSLMNTIDFDKQSVLNELIKRRDTFLTELAQKRFDEITRLNNKATSIFEELTLGIDGFEEELEVFKRNKINEFTQYVLSVFEEYKKIIKQISNTLTESFNRNSEEKHNSLQKKYTDYLQELLNSFTGHIESLNLKKIEITNHLGSDSNSGLWKRIIDNISELTQSKLEYLTENTTSMKEEINNLTSLKKQEINDLRDDVISNIGTTNESDYKNNPSLRKSVINAINDTKESALNSIESKKTSSLETLESFKEETKTEILNKSIEGINNLIHNIKSQKHYVVLPKNTTSVVLPNNFLTRGDLLVALNGNILTENTHYTFDVPSKTFTLNQSLNYDSELYFFEQFPVKGDHSLNFIISGRKLGIKRESDLEYQFTEDLGVPGPAGPKGEAGKAITNIIHLNGNNFRMFFGNDNFLDFELPNLVGPKGDKGDKGETGTSGPQGETGERGAGIENIQLIENNKVQINYGDNQVFTFKVPTVKGDKGEPGLNGNHGETPIITLNRKNYKLNINGLDVGESLKPTSSDLADLRLPLNQIDNLNNLRINWNQINNIPNIEWNQINHKPSLFTPTIHSHSWSQITEKPNFNNSINSEAENEIATPKAVKTSYDKANEAFSLLKTKEPTINKRSGFNLDKTDSYEEDNTNKLGTARALKRLYDELVSQIGAIRLTWNSITGKPNISSSVTSTSETDLANSKAVKTANDNANSKVSKSGNEDVRGVKSFLNSTYFKSSIEVSNDENIWSQNTKLTFGANNNDGFIEYRKNNSIKGTIKVLEDGKLTYNNNEVMFINDLIKSLGLNYAGLITRSGYKIAGNAYWHPASEKLYKCIRATTATTPSTNDFIPVDNNSLLSKISDISSTINARHVAHNSSKATSNVRIDRDNYSRYKFIQIVYSSYGADRKHSFFMSANEFYNDGNIIINRGGENADRNYDIRIYEESGYIKGANIFKVIFFN